MEIMKPRIGALEEHEAETLKEFSKRPIDDDPLFRQLQEKLETTLKELNRLRTARVDTDGYKFRDYSSARLAAQGHHPQSFDRLILGVMGLSGEVGEVVEHVKKHYFHGKPLLCDHLIKELGDVLWYVMYTADAIGSSLEEVAKANDKKLSERYPEGFTIETASKL